jgi:hypothetical protein
MLTTSMSSDQEIPEVPANDIVGVMSKLLLRLSKPCFENKYNRLLIILQDL